MSSKVPLRHGLELVRAKAYQKLRQDIDYRYWLCDMLPLAQSRFLLIISETLGDATKLH